MAYIPTISTLQTQIENDMRTELGITQTWYGKVFLKVLALVQAARMKLLYIYVASIQKNIFVDTADSESVGGTLERFGRVKINRNPYPAIAGVYNATGTGTIHGVIKAGTTFKNLINNLLYVLDGDYLITLTSFTISVRCLTAGTIGQLLPGDTITATSPLSNANDTLTISAETTQPIDAETIEEYRTACLQAFRLEPQGGASADYRLWSLDVTGIRTSYPYTKYQSPWDVQIFVEANPTDSAPNSPAGVPTALQLTQVSDVIELDPDTTKLLSDRGRRPIGDYQVDCLPVVACPITVEIDALSDKTSTTINAITTSIQTALYNIRPYIAGADGEIKNDTLTIATIIAAIFNAIDKSVIFNGIILSYGVLTIPIGGYSNKYFGITPVQFTSKTFGAIPTEYGEYPYLYSVQTP